MTEQQLHELALLAVSKSECSAKGNPVEVAAELFRQYSEVMDLLVKLNQGTGASCVIDTFGNPTGDCAK